MTPHKTGASAYHRFCCAFVRTRDGGLVSCTGPQAASLERSWDAVVLALASSVFRDAGVATTIRGPLLQTEKEAALVEEELLDAGLAARSKASIRIDAVRRDAVLTVYESEERGRREDGDGDGDVVFGVVFQQPPCAAAADADLDDVFARLLLSDIRLFTTPPLTVHEVDKPPREGDRTVTDRIVDLFDARLRYVVDDDKWAVQGREYFHGRVREFVRRNARVEFCLPAFPCKSSSLDKVAGVLPDRAEELALETLHSFVEAIEEIYEPGAKLWIVSDGHVFSDCIGVDDEVVDRYTAGITEMSARIGERSVRGADRVGFMSLVDMFDLAHSTPEIKLALSLRLDPLEAHIPTRRTAEAELSRQLLLQAGRSPDSVLRARIEAGEHSALKLYRGFSRFMAEDLALNRHTAHLSRSKLKKLATRVSFEMMQRNEAYSNLVELFFPNHVRLSIHAHNNAGPKFGIRLLGSGVRALEGIVLEAGGAAAAEMRSVDLLHVPTPWHNCLVQVAGRDTLIMTKSKVVRDALAKGTFVGGWVDGDHRSGGVAGHFRLQVPPLPPPPPVTQHLSSNNKAHSRYDGEAWDRQDMLDCCDPGNPYLRGRDAVLESEMRYWYASSAGIHLF